MIVPAAGLAHLFLPTYHKNGCPTFAFEGWEARTSIFYRPADLEFWHPEVRGHPLGSS
jgi:hypothetical protein